MLKPLTRREALIILLLILPLSMAGSSGASYLLTTGGTLSGNLNLGNNLALNIGAAGTDFTAGGGLVLTDVTSVLSFGGTTSAFPALKRVTTAIEARLADDSGFARLDANAFVASDAVGIRVACDGVNNFFRASSGSQFLWNSAASGFGGSQDTGLARSAAGVVRVSDGSAGFGGLIVGTADATGLGFGSMDLNISTGTGSPEGVVTADTGSLFLRTDGGAGTSLYVKETNDASNVGWVGK